MNLGIVLAFIAVWVATEGDIQLAWALRSLPVGQPLWAYPPMWAAVSLLALHFALWLQVLKRLSLSLAVPITACNYVFNALLVQSRLSEDVSARTWAGTFLISLGVLLVTTSQNAQPEESFTSS